MIFRKKTMCYIKIDSTGFFQKSITCRPGRKFVCVVAITSEYAKLGRQLLVHPSISGQSNTTVCGSSDLPFY